MGRRDRSSLRSDSGFGDDQPEATPRCPTDHPLTLKGYDIGPASKLHVGDVFEFVWADAPQFDWEWKCLGYNRFIVLRHSDTFPHHCICIPISTGGVNKHQFAKPGIDSFQQGFVFVNGEPNPGYTQPKGGPKLQYSPVGIEVRPGRIRIKEDSRANYADILQIEHDAHVLVVGDVVKYFDRVRRNVNKAFMRQSLRTALEKYQAEKAAGTGKPTTIVESVVDDQGGGALDNDNADAYTLNEGPTDDEGDNYAEQDVYAEQEVAMARVSLSVPHSPLYQESVENLAIPGRPRLDRRETLARLERSEKHRRTPIATPMTRTPLVSSEEVARLPPEDRPRSRAPSRDRRAGTDYDYRSMHRITMPGTK